MRVIIDIPNMAQRIADELGIPLAKAEEYANAIGDTPEVDAQGKVVIRDFITGKITDRLSIRVYGRDF